MKTTINLEEALNKTQENPLQDLQIQELISQSNQEYFISGLRDLGFQEKVGEIETKQRNKIPAGTKIYNLKSIKKICTRYDLRFLPTSYYTGVVPDEAIAKAYRFSKETDISLNPAKFFICAPSKAFKLTKRPIDPILFYQIKGHYKDNWNENEEAQYMLIHKWGKDLGFLRANWNIFKRIGLAILPIVIVTTACVGVRLGEGSREMLGFLGFISMVPCWMYLHTINHNIHNDWNSPYAHL